MEALAWTLLLTFLAGVTIPLGGIISRLVHMRDGHVREDVLGAIMAFGGGALLSAVVLVLVPDGLEGVRPFGAVAAFVGGAVVALLADQWLAQRGTQAGQFAAMMSDFVPESVALGAAVATGSLEAGILLAVLIGLQNLPEGFSAYRDIHEDLERRGRYAALAVLGAVALLGPLAGWIGVEFAAAHTAIAVVLMASSGAIMTFIFQDIAPHAHRHGHIAPTFGAIGGFTLGLAGHAWLL